MRYLLDTHVWLWLLAEPERLEARLRDRLADPATDLVLSAASSWEIAIKYERGRLPLPESPATYVPSRMRRSGTTGLAVEHAHAVQVASLIDHHRDPFDRMLVAQAQVEDLSIVTADPVFEAYDVEIVAAG